MKRLDKIINLTNNIYSLYQELINMEYSGLKGSQAYLEKIEYLSICKEFEDKYYNELARKNSLDDIIKLQHILNVDDLIKRDYSDLNFAIYDLTDPYNKEIFVARRIFNKLGVVIVKKMENDELLGYMKSELPTLDLKRQSFYIENREILILDRAHVLVDMLRRTIDNIYLRYIFFMQQNINEHKFKEQFISKKYSLIFICDNIENKMLNEKFEINDDFIKKVKDKETSALNQELYDTILNTYSKQLLESLILESLYLEEVPLEDRNFIISDFEALVRATALEVNIYMKNLILYMLNQIGNVEEKQMIRKELTHVMKLSREDKKYLY